MAKYKNPRYLLDGVEYPIDGSSPVPDTAQVLFFNEKDKADYPADEGQRKEILSEAGIPSNLSETEIGRSPLANKAKTPAIVRKALTRATPVPQLSDLERRKAAMYDYLKNHEPKKFDALTFEQRQLHARALEQQKAENLTRDMAEFNKKKEGEILPSNFENFLGDKYASATGKEKPGLLLRAGRVMNDYLSARPAIEGGSDSYGALYANPGMSLIRKGLNAIREDENGQGSLRARYDAITAPKTESPSFGETMQFIKNNPGQVGSAMLEGMTDPQELPANLASMAVGAGVGTAAKAASAVRFASPVGRLAQRGLTAGGGILPGIAADAGIGGLSGAYQSGEFSGGDFATGAVPSVLLGGVGAGLKAAGSKILGKPNAPAPGPTLNESWAKASRTAVLQGGPVSAEMPASFLLEHVGSNTKTPGAKRRLEEVGQQLAADPALRQRIAPDLLDDELADTDLVLAALEGAKKREAEAARVAEAERVAALPVEPTSKEVDALAKSRDRAEKMRQDLPTSEKAADALFAQKDGHTRLRKANAAYRALREHDMVPVNPRYEGRTDADLLGERLIWLQEERKKLDADKDMDKWKQKQLKEENDFQSQAVLDEIKWAEEKGKAISDLEFAGTMQFKHGVPGRTLDEFVSLPPEQQGLVLRDIDEIGSAGEYLREALGPFFDDLQRIAATSGYDPKRLGSKIKEVVAAQKKGYAGSVGGLSGEVGGSPTGSSQYATGGYSQGFYREANPQGASVPQLPQASLDAPGAPDPAGPQQAIAGGAQGQLGYDPSRAGGQINLPNQGTAGQTPITVFDRPVGSNVEIPNPGDRKFVAPDKEAQGQLSADEDFGVKSDDYAASDIEDRVSILEADLKSRPELAAEVGIDDALLKRSENSNSHTAGKAKKEIKAKLTQFAKDNPELPESFR